MAHLIECTDIASQFEARPDETILEAAQRSQIDLPHACQFGGCGTCRVRITRGTVAYEEFPAGLTHEEAAAGYALTCQARATSDISLAAMRRLPPCSEAGRYEAKVTAIEPLTGDVTRLCLALPDHARLQYRAGQYADFIMPDASHRSFSMASPPHGQAIDFHVKRVPGGQFTHQMLDQLRPGDALMLELPQGTFCYHQEDYRPLLMVATGTGIAPIKSIIESLRGDDDCPPIMLYWGVRTLADLYLHQDIAAWADSLSDFTYVPVLSRPHDGWTGRSGHVQDVILQDMDDFSEHAIYLCGSPDMIAQAKRSFLDRQASVHHIYAEGFTLTKR